MVFLSFVLDMPGKWGGKEAEGGRSMPELDGAVEENVGKGVSSLDDGYAGVEWD